MRTTLRAMLWSMTIAIVSLAPRAGAGSGEALAGGRPAASPVLRTVPIVGVSTLAVDELSGHVFAVASPGGPTAVYTLDGRTGAILRRTPLAGQFASAFTVDGATGRVFVATPRPSQVFVLDARTGALLRTVRLAGIPSAIAVDERTGRVFLAEADTGRVDVLDARDGAPLRTVPVGTRPLALAVSASTGRVFVANLGGGSVSVLDARDGTPLRTVPVGGEPQFVAVDPGVGHAFVSGEYGALSILDARTGILVRAITVNILSAQLAVDQQTHRVFLNILPDNGGAVNVYDSRTGNLLHTTPLNNVPVAAIPVVNQQTGHVLVLVSSTVGGKNLSGVGSGAMMVLDGLTGAARNTVTVGHALSLIAVNGQAQRAFGSTVNDLVVLDAARL